MFTHSGSIEAGSLHLEVVAATSYVDISKVADPTPLIKKRPELFIADWKGGTEVLALVDEGRMTAAGILRYREQQKAKKVSALEVFAVGAWDETDGNGALLKAAMRERVEARKATLGTESDGSIRPIPATVHWDAEPPTVEVRPGDPGVGVAGFEALREEVHQSFLEDLQSPYGSLFPKTA